MLTPPVIQSYMIDNRRSSVGVVGCSMMESGVSRQKNSLVGVTKNIASVGMYSFYGESRMLLCGVLIFLSLQHL